MTRRWKRKSSRDWIRRACRSSDISLSMDVSTLYFAVSKSPSDAQVVKPCEAWFERSSFPFEVSQPFPARDRTRVFRHNQILYCTVHNLNHLR